MWLEIIKPYTKRTVVNSKNKTIFLLHPHFEEGFHGYRALIKGLKNNIHNGYSVECSGFATIKGYIILKKIYDHLIRFNNINDIHLNISRSLDTYTLKIKFK